MSADSSATPAAVVPPLPERAAMAILGSMLILIVLLVAVLVQTTWVDPASASEAPVIQSEHLAGR